MFKQPKSILSLTATMCLTAGIALAQQNPQTSQPTSRPTQSQSEASSDMRTQTDKKTKTDKMNQSGKMDHSDKMHSDKAMTGMKVSSSDRSFAMKAADGGMAEVKMAELALSKTTNDEVKQFAQRMIDDHSKANQELMSIASTKGITLPAEPSAKHKAMMNKLSAMNGANFDRAYIKHMREDHKADVALFEKQSNAGRDADLKAFAAKTLPTLKEHKMKVEDLSMKMGTGMRDKTTSSTNNQNR